jgi:hypothetical protein
MPNLPVSSVPSRALLALLALIAPTSCSRAPEPAPNPGPGSTPSAVSSTTPRSAAGTASPSAKAAPALALRWNDPPGWVRKPPSTSMRAAEYVVPRAAGDSDDGECVVITFGPGQGGGVDENVDRWVGQFSSATKPERTKQEVHGLTVTRVEVAGTYTAMRMPGSPSSPAARPGWRLLGAIVEAPSGLWFFKVTGPDATMKAARSELDAMLATASPSDRAP